MPASPSPAPATPAPGKPCQGRTQTGVPCPWKAEGKSAFCLLHDPARAQERREALSQRGRNGKKKQTQKKVEAAREVSLATTAQLRSMLEEAAAMVRASNEGACTKAHAIARLCSVAHDTIKTSDLEREVAELRAQVEAKLGIQ